MPNYQDFTFKTDVPVGKKGTISVWGIGGRSNISFLGKEQESEADSYGDENLNTRVKYFTGMGAISYEHRFSTKTYGKLTLSGSRTEQEVNGDTVIYALGNIKDVLEELPLESSKIENDKLSLNASLDHKFNAKNKVSGGIILDLSRFDLESLQLHPNNQTLRDTKGETVLSQAYVQWKHRLSEKITLNSGVSALHYELNNQAVLEPRLGAIYMFKDGSSFSTAYGLHSNLQPLLLSFYKTQNPDGSTSLTNKDLGFTRSHHFVAGYQRNLTTNLHLKVEAYFQSIFDAPVERIPGYYSVLTEGVDFEPLNKGNLVNAGSGTNTGVEITLEKYFSNSYYFLFNTSIFDSKYKGSDGVERNTPFNGRYVINGLAGKEFTLGRNNNIFSINWKVSAAGGRYIRLIDLESSAIEKRAVYDDRLAFTNQLNDYFRMDLKFGYKINRKKSTHEFAVDLQNITNRQNVFQQGYNPRTNKIGIAYQQGFLPIPFYRLTF